MGDHLSKDLLKGIPESINVGYCVSPKIHEQRVSTGTEKRKEKQGSGDQYMQLPS